MTSWRDGSDVVIVHAPIHACWKTIPDNTHRPSSIMRKVVIVDPQPLTRKGIAYTVNAQPDFMVCGLAGNGKELSSLLKDVVPDLLIFDFPLPDTGGPDIVNSVHAEYPDVRIIVLSPYEDQKCIERTGRPDPNVATLMARAWLGKGDPARARQLIESVLKANPDHRDARRVLDAL